MNKSQDKIILPLTNESQRLTAVLTLQNMPIDDGYDIVVKKRGHLRSENQHGLMWLWHTEYAGNFGYTKDRAHKMFKYFHVLPILLAEDEEGRLTKLYNAAKTDPEMMEELTNLISTTHLTPKQMAAALTEYDMKTASKGYVFSRPEDKYYEALGIR